MPDRSVRVRLEANVVGFIAQVGGKAVEAVEKLEGAAAKANATLKKTAGDAAGLGDKVGSGATKAVGHLDRLTTAAKKNEQSFNTVASGATKVGLAAAVGLGAAAKAAIDWESAWTGVTKTVNGSTAQMAELEGQLRGMAKTLPESHAQIAAVAEAAGQLGVRREDIAAFTKVMVNLGETTNLTSDEASTSIAQLMNVMQTAPQDVGRLGAALVALGNNGASTEKDILSMAERISGSGKIIGLSEIQVLGYASALANVGIEAEAGGTAISQIFTRIDKAVSEGGQGLSDFAKVSGLTADQFKQKFATDASGATQLFIEGLGLINQAGGDVNGTLAELGITEIRQRDAVLRLAASGTNLADSLKTSGDGWRENTALVNEAAKRYATSESQIRIAWNNIKDAAITAGGALLPVVAQVAGAIGGLAQVFGDLPAPVRSTASALAGIVAVGGLSAAGMLKAAVAAGQLKEAWTSVGRAGRGLTLAAGGIGIALVAATAIYSAFSKRNAEAKQRVDDLRGTLDEATGAITGNTRAYVANQLATNGLAQKAKDIHLSLSEVTSAALGNAPALESVNRQLDAMIEAGKTNGPVTTQAAYDLALQGQAALALKDALFGTNKELTEAQRVQLLAAEGAQENAGATQDAGQKAAGAAGSTDALGRALDGTADSAQTAADAIKIYIDGLFLVPNLVLGVRDAQRGVQAAIDDATTSLKENGRTLDQHTAKGRDNQAAIDAIATASQKQSEAYLNANASQETITAGALEARTAYADLAHKMGLPIPAAKALAEQVIKIPDKKATEVTNNAAGKPLTDAKTYDQQLRGTLPKLNTPFTNNAAGTPLTAAQHYDQVLRGTLPQVKTFVSAPGATTATGQVDALSRSVNNLPTGKTVNVTLNTYKNLVETTTHKDIGVRVPPPPVKADGGFHPGGYPSYADGKLPGQAMVAPGKGRGLVQWAEQETGGEAFIPLAPSKRDRSEKILGQVASQFGLGLVKSFAAGGFNLPGGRLVSPESLLSQLGAPFNPLSGINYSGTLATQTSALKQFNTALATLNKARTAGNPKALAAAWADYQKKLDAARKATDAHTASVEALTAQQKDALALADQIAGKQLSGAGIVDLFGGSLTAKGLLGDLQGQGQQTAEFAKQLAALRKLGLSQGLLQQLADAGSASGGDVAQSILDAGKGMVDALNKAQSNLEKQADIVGSGVATDLYGKTVAGKRGGGGPVMAGKTYEVDEYGREYFTAPVDGQIVPHGVDPRRYINGGSGGGSGTTTVEHHYHQTNQFSGVDYTTADVIAQRSTAKQQLMGRY